MIFKGHEVPLILSGSKFESLRALRANGKGYYRVGSIQPIFEGRNFKDCKGHILIYKKEFVNIHDLTESDFLALGYHNKEAYMSQNYNQTNGSPERVKYTFIELNILLELVESLEICPDNLLYVLGIVGKCEKITAGLKPFIINEGFDPEAIKEAFITIQANIRGFLNEK